MARMKKEYTEQELRKLTGTENGRLEENDTVMTEIFSKLKKDIYRAIVGGNVGKNEIRFIYDMFVQKQKSRIQISNRITAIENGSDFGNSHVLLDYCYNNEKILEETLRIMLGEAAESSAVGKWLMSIKGIGPTLAGAILAYFDISRATSAGSFWDYAGLNDYNHPRLNADQATEIVDKVLNEYGTSELTDDVLLEVAKRTGRNVRFILSNCFEEKEKKGSDGVYRVRSKSALVKALTILPYNKALKTLCYKISDCFVKNMNRGSLYGAIYLERKAYEKDLNEKGAYADQAAEILRKKNISDKKTREAYESGKLPDGHIEARCRRYAVRIFLSHLFEAMYIDTYKKPSPTLYVIQFLNHKDYIEPEVPFSEFGIIPAPGSVVDPKYTNKVDQSIRDSLVLQGFSAKSYTSLSAAKTAEELAEDEAAFTTEDDKDIEDEI